MMIFKEIEEVRRNAARYGNETPEYLVSPAHFDRYRKEIERVDRMSDWCMRNPLIYNVKTLSAETCLKKGIELPAITYRGGRVHCSLSCAGVYALVGAAVERPEPLIDLIGR